MNKHFSPMEIKLIKLIGRRKVSIAELCDLVYKNHIAPFNARHVVAGAVRRIMLKCIFYKLKWTLSGTSDGLHGRIIWRVKR